MKKKCLTRCSLVVLFVLVVMLIGCRAAKDSSTVPVPDEGSRLTIYTSLPEDVYIPIIREFEYRTGIWVEIEAGNAMPKLKSVSEGEENHSDLIFGCQAEVLDRNRDLFASYDSPFASDILEEYVCPDRIWYPFAATHTVIIYNSKLVVDNYPAGWNSIMTSSWSNHVAHLDPDQSDIGYITIQTVADAKECSIEEITAKLPADLRFETSDDVIDAVASGSCHLGIVPEDVAIRAVASDYNVKILYPKEGVYTNLNAMAIFRSCDQAENAQKFIDFLLDKEVQRYLQANFAMHSVYERIEDVDIGSQFAVLPSATEPSLLPEYQTEEVEE